MFCVSHMLFTQHNYAFVGDVTIGGGKIKKSPFVILNAVKNLIQLIGLHDTCPAFM